MTKYCVKKPFTIFVAVIAVMVIGVVSLMRMKTDLLPDMSLPYLMIITTDPGASPEKVESEVTAPMEQALGTVTGVENITSVSAENYSMITLEFVEDTNMDSAMVKVTAQLNQLELPEICGTPNLLELSMDMMATMYTTVSYEGKDIYEISDFTEEVIKPYFERQDGGASVTAVGSVEKTVEVRLNEKKINRINDKILDETNEKLKEARKQIEDAQTQLEDGQKQLADAKSELEKKQSDLKKKQSETSRQLAEASLALDQAQAAKAAYEANLTSLRASKAGLEAEKKAYDDNHIEDTYNEINGAFGTAHAALSQPAQLAGITIPSDIDDALANPEQFEAFVQWAAQMGLGDQIKELTYDNLQQLSDVVTKRLPQIETGLANLETQILAVEQAVKQVNSQMDQIDQRYKEANSGSFDAAVSFASGDAQMANGLSGIESSEKELEGAKEELKEAKKQYRQSKKAALDNANISSLVNMDTLSQLVTAQDFSMPAGYIRDGKADSENQWLIKVGEHYDSVENLEEMLLCRLPGAGNVRMSDVADITVIDNAGENYAKTNGEEGILLSIFKGSTASTSDVAKTCEKAIEKLEKDYEGLSITAIMNQGDYITMFIDSILQSMISGALLAVLVLVLFFKDAKPTLVVAFSIPFSVLFAILIMYFSDISINIMTLAGLGLAIGMLVDNSIVVIENIYRIRNHGISAPRAAVQGAKQVAGPIISSTLTTVCVFLPMIFTTGMVAQLMVPFAMTISYALTASLIVALTVVPTAGSIILQNTKEKRYPWFEKIQEIYGTILGFCLKIKIIPLSLAILLLVICIRQVMQMGITMLPEMTGEQISVSVSVPEETEKEDAFRTADQVMEAVLSVDGVATVGAMDGSSTSSMLGAGAGGENFLNYSFAILLDEDIRDIHKIREISDKIEEASQGLDCEISVSSSAMGDMTAMMGSGLSLNIYGDSMEKLLEISGDVQKIVEQVEGFDNISNGQEDGAEEIHLIINKDKAMKKGLTVAQIYSTLSARLTTEKDSVTMSVGDTDMTVQIVDETELLNKDNLMEMELEASVPKEDGTTEEKIYKLGDFAEMQYGKGLASVSQIGRASCRERV